MSAYTKLTEFSWAFVDALDLFYFFYEIISKIYNQWNEHYFLLT